MSGVVVGVRRAAAGATSVRWASMEADLHGLPLTLVHAWDEPVDIAVDLGPDSLPDLRGTATSMAVHSRPVDALLAGSPDLIVLGTHVDGHLSHLARACLRAATGTVAIVPDGPLPSTGRVVVGVCGGDPSRNALRWAADEARLRRAQLVVVHAWQLHTATAKELLRPSRAIAAHRDAAQDRLRAWVSGILGDIDAEVTAVHGGPLDVLLHAGTDADLLVLGRGGHCGPGRIFHDSVGNDLSGLATCPIVFVHHRRDPT